MFGFIITLGLTVLIVLAVAAGVVLAGQWNRVTGLRLDARRRELWTWEQELLMAAGTRGCAGCELLRSRAELQRPLAG